MNNQSTKAMHGSAVPYASDDRIGRAIADAKQADTASPGEVFIEMQRLDGSVGMLTSLLATLVTRLSPVLTPLPPEQACKSSLDSVPHTQIGQRLRACDCEVRENIARLNDALERLELPQ